MWLCFCFKNRPRDCLKHFGMVVVSFSNTNLVHLLFLIVLQYQIAFLSLHVLALLIANKMHYIFPYINIYYSYEYLYIIYIYLSIYIFIYVYVNIHI